MPELTTEVPDAQFFGQEPVSEAAKSAAKSKAPKQKEDKTAEEEQRKKVIAEMKVFRFPKPLQIADQEYKTLSLDFAKLSAKDLIFVEGQARTRYNLNTYQIYKESGFRLLAVLFLNKIPFEDVEMISWPDALNITEQALHAFTLGD